MYVSNIVRLVVINTSRAHEGYDVFTRFFFFGGGGGVVGVMAILLK